MWRLSKRLFRRGKKTSKHIQLVLLEGHTKIRSILCKTDIQPVVLHVWTQENNDIYIKVVNRIYLNTHPHEWMYIYICTYIYTYVDTRITFSKYYIVSIKNVFIYLILPKTTNSFLLLIAPHLKDAETSTTRWNTRQKQVCMRDTNQTKAQYFQLHEMRFAHIIL